MRCHAAGGKATLLHVVRDHPFNSPPVLQYGSCHRQGLNSIGQTYDVIFSENGYVLSAMYVTLQWLLFVFVVRCCGSALPPVPRWRHSTWLAEEQSSPRLYWASQGENLFLLIEANTIGSIHLELDSWDAVVVWVDDATGEPHIKVGFEFQRYFW